MRNPTVTVFIPVYNGEAFLAEAIDSILAQHYHDFELLIIDDGSTDQSATIIESYEDNRIRFLKNEANKGISFTRNRAILKAKGQFMAFLDADDIALPERLEKQVNYFNRHPETAVCGSHAMIIDENGQATGEYMKVPVKRDEIKTRLAFYNVFVNSTVMYRLDVLRKTKGYYEGVSEDYEMAIQLNPFYLLANLDEVLVKYRVHKKSTTIVFSEQMCRGEKWVLKRIHQQLGIGEDPELISIHHTIVMGNAKKSLYSVADYEKLFSILKKANKEKKIYPHPAFDKLLFSMWYDKIRQMGKRRALMLFFKRPLFAWEFFTFKMLRKMFKQTLSLT